MEYFVVDMNLLREEISKNPQRVKVIKDIPDEDNYFGHEVEVGTVLTLFRGSTYGCISWPGVAVTVSQNPFEGPFAQLDPQYFEII
jgi:hypothetical protein